MRWYNLHFEHNSHNTMYREPFGACPAGTPVRLRLFCDDSVLPEKAECIVNGEPVKMACTRDKNLYECTVETPKNPSLLFYYFRIETGNTAVYYGNNACALGGLGEEYTHIPDKQFQITVYDKNFRTPDVMKNSVMYQIFPDRFYRGKDTPFHGIKRTWGEEPYWKTEQFGEEYLSNDFFGGNFDGIREKLPYLKDLGITSVYLNPISKAFSNHRYDTGDYEIPDETLGTAEDFTKLCREGEKHGIRFILDGVYSHTGSDSRYFNKNGNYDSIGAYQSEKSPYASWYTFKEFPDKYESWWGFKTLPNVNELDKAYTDYIIDDENSVINKWISRGASGFRLDVADELPDEFIKKFRTALKKASPDALLIGEVWEDASNKISYGKRREFLFGDELDSVMNYVFRDAVLTYLLGCDSRLFTMRIMSLIENYPKEALYTAMNLLSSHDVPRAMTVLSGAPDFRSMSREEQYAHKINPIDLHFAERRMVLAICLQMTLPGIPCIYYGDEIGLTGYADPFNRQCMDWEKDGGVILSQTKLFTKLRNENKNLRTGLCRFIYEKDGVTAFIRYGEDNDGSVIVIVNPNDENRSFNLDIPDAKRISDTLSGECISQSGNINITLQPLSYRLFSPER